MELTKEILEQQLAEKTKALENINKGFILLERSKLQLVAQIDLINELLK